MPTGTYVPAIPPQYFTNAGDPASGFKLFTYASGGTTKLATYTDVGLTVANTNPIVLDSAGRATIFLTAASYKFVMAPPTDSDPPSSPIWTRDNIGAIPQTNVDLDVVGVAGETLTAGNGVYLSEGDGGLTAGRWYKWDADNTYSSTSAKQLGMMPADLATGVSGSVRLVGRITGLSALTPGTNYFISATAGALTSVAPTNARAVAQADTTTTVVFSPWEPVPVASATSAGTISLGTQTLGTGTKSVDKLIYRPGGVTTFDANVSGRILGPFITSVATSGTTETSTIATAPTVKANTLNASGDILRATYVGVASANAQATTFRVKIGGTTITTVVFTPNATLAAWILQVDVHRTGAATQNITTRLMWSEGVLATTAPFVDVIQGTKDLTTDLTFDITMQRAVAGSVTFRGAYFEVIGA